ncbi:phage integrase family protein (plasmid) [Bacillus thuringiensis serovar tolworthi]|uniref:Phage integrase family protein n=1 Tax=Bacillus thuringiensis subsp. tolworthi TaxID=1442 RepID=A0A9W4A3W4_BACTO|nr:phage integrase family protein [Bacillus thuringiensis serovar tolworthi]
MNETICLEKTLEAFSVYLNEQGRKHSTIQRYVYLSIKNPATLPLKAQPLL